MALTLALGSAFMPLGCGGSGGGFSHVASGQGDAVVPEGVAQELRTCTLEHKAHLERSRHAVSFDVKLANNGQVDAVALRASTLGDEDLEACMAHALRSLSEDDLPMRRSEDLPRGPVAPQARALLGANPAALAAAACIAQPELCVLVLGISLVGAAGAYYIGVEVYMQPSTHPGTRKHYPPAVTTPPAVPTAVSMATAMPTTTAIPVPRRYPNQTCDDKELDRLEDEKDKLCKSGYAAACSGKASDKTKARTPCSAILLSIQQRFACLNARKLVQDKCFGGNPDPGHKSQIDQTQQGIDNCEALKLINCAKGHPMAGL